jgi:hypothetical protein
MYELLESALFENQKIQKERKKKLYTKPELFKIVEEFMKRKELIGYGGMAINMTLPKDKQFYRDNDVPDYDFFSNNAIPDIIELSNIISKKYDVIEVKSALNDGTYKLFVNSIPLVDITQIEDDLFKNLKKTSIPINKIYYAPYNYLRMSMYQELSRPLGDLSRWKKVYERLDLLNTNHPLIIRRCNVDDHNPKSQYFKKVIAKLSSCVLFGDYAMYYYQHLFPKKFQTEQQECLYVLSDESIWDKLKGFTYTKTQFKNKFLNVYEVKFDVSFLYVFITDSCQSYNIVKVNKRSLKIASYDTILSIYYGISFMDTSINKFKILSYCYLLSKITDHKDPIMRRFKMPCIGEQSTFESLRHERDLKFKEYRKTGKYRNLFFKYKPNKTKNVTSKKVKKN